MDTSIVEVYWTTFEHAIFGGQPLHLAATDRGLCMISLPRDTTVTLNHWTGKRFPQAVLKEDRKRLSPYLKQLQEYCDGDRSEFDLSLDMQGTEFQLSVWQALMSIPYGHTCSYSDIAAKIGKPQAVRAVGTANGANPIPIIVPCHRVIGKNSALTGYSGGLKIKEALLHREGFRNYSAVGHTRFCF